MAKIKASGVLRAGVKADKPGYSAKTIDGKYVGMDVDIVEMIAQALGIPQDKIQFTEVTSENREIMLEQNKVDVVAASYGIKPGPAKVVTFAGPYAENPNAVMVEAGNPEKIAQFSDLNGKRVCATAGSTIVPALQAFAPGLIQVGLQAAADCATALQNHQVDAVAVDTATLMGFANATPGKFVVLTNLPEFGTQSTGVAVQKGQADFCEFIDGVLQENWNSGVFQKDWNDTLAPSIGAPRPLQFIPCL